jgi:hypothetical protein
MTITLKLTEAQVEALNRALYVFDINYDSNVREELQESGLTEILEALDEAEKIQTMLDQKVWEEQEIARLVSENPGVSKTHIRKVVQQHIKANA